MKRHRNPFSNDYYCVDTPNKVRYLKAVFAWKAGASQIAKTGSDLYMYRCDGCKGGWHLTHRPRPGAVRIDTKAHDELSEELSNSET